MARGPASSYPDDESFGSQRVVRRSLLFFLFPMLVISLLAGNLGWEVLRANSGRKAAAVLTFSVIDAATTANLLALATGLLLARMQYARAVRPVISFAIDDEGIRFSPDSDEWRVWIYNAGSGIAVVEDYRYYVRFVGQPVPNDRYHWVPLSVVNDQMRSRGLVDGRDFHIRWRTRGSALPSVQSYTDGSMLAWFTVKALAELERFDIVLRVTDAVGDSHQRVFPCVNRLPSVARESVARYRRRPSTSTG